MTNIDLSKKWHFKTKKCRKVHQDHQLSNNEGPYCQFSITMICSLFSSSYHRSVNCVMDKNWNTGAFWGTTELSSKWILSPLLHLFSSLTSLCFLLIGLQEICCPPFSSFWKYPTALVTISHSPHLPGHLEDYISHHPAVDKIMWLLLANGLGVEVSPVTLGRKHLRASVCDSPHSSSLLSEASVEVEVPQMKTATLGRAASPESCRTHREGFVGTRNKLV